MSNLHPALRQTLLVAGLLAWLVTASPSSDCAQQVKGAAPDRSPLRPLTESLKAEGTGLKPLGEGPTTNQAAPGVDVEQMLSPGGLSSTL